MTDGPLRIIAGAGTGKTRTLIERTAFLIREKKTAPERILCLTFTNKAARELNERLKKRGLPEVHSLTFHALAARLLRTFWRENFKIIGRADQEKILSGILHHEDQKQMKEILADIEMIDFKKPVSGLAPERLEEILTAYKKTLNERNEIDFTGLLVTLLDVWLEDAEVLKACQNLFLYIMVDEYQDLNPAQVRMAQVLAGVHKNLCVVGDPDQTIYSWRGADPGSMAEFAVLYPETKTVTLTENYRNPPDILKGAENLIAKNPDRLPKTLQADKTGGGRIQWWQNETEFAENETLAHLLKHYFGSPGAMHEADQLETDREGKLRKLSDLAILYRTQGEGRKISTLLNQWGCPCQMSSPQSFWERKEIADFIKSLREWSACAEALPQDRKLSDWIRENVGLFSENQKLTGASALRLNHLIAYAAIYDRLPFKDALISFLDEAATEQEADNLAEADRINLLTLHAAKGLEFPVVIIMGLEDENIPNSKASQTPAGLCEERRLLYVGMTRALEELHLLNCKKRFKKKTELSRFIPEIGYENLTPGALPKTTLRQIKRKEIKKAQMQLF